MCVVHVQAGKLLTHFNAGELLQVNAYAFGTFFTVQLSLAAHDSTGWSHSREEIVFVVSLCILHEGFPVGFTQAFPHSTIVTNTRPRLREQTAPPFGCTRLAQALDNGTCWADTLVVFASFSEEWQLAGVLHVLLVCVGMCRLLSFTVATPTAAERSSAAKPTATTTAAERSTVAKPTAAEPTATEPTATDAIAAERSTAAKPTAAKPTDTEPTATEPTATGPTANEPTAALPTATTPSATTPTLTWPTAVTPTAALPTATAPTAAAPTSATPTSTKSTATVLSAAHTTAAISTRIVACGNISVRRKSKQTWPSSWTTPL